MNFLDHLQDRKIQEKAVALGGGLAVFLSLTTILIGSAGFFYLLAREGNHALLPEGSHIHIPGLANKLPLLASLLGGCGAMFLLGLVDDKKNLSAKIKLCVQGIIAFALVYAGVRADFFSANPLLGGTLSFFWILLITNAFNLLDNMDGECAGVAFISAAFFFAVAVLTGQLFIAASLALFCGACGGFLLHNYPKASVYLGNGGSYFIGSFLGTLTILATYYFEKETNTPIFVVAFPVLVLAVPLFDTATVLLIRLKEKRPLFEGDRSHFAHRLVALGFSPAQAVAAIYLLSLATGLSSLLLYFVSEEAALLIVAQIILVLLFVSLIEGAARKS